MIKNTEVIDATSQTILILNWHQELLERVPIP